MLLPVNYNLAFSITSFCSSEELNIYPCNSVTLFQDIPIIKLIFNSYQRVVLLFGRWEGAGG